MLRGNPVEGTPDVVEEATVHPHDQVARVVVPDVSGDDEEVALEKLRLSGLRPGKRSGRASPSHVTGAVVRTLPRAGSLLSRGERVDYVVALPARRTEGGSRHVPGGRQASRPSPASKHGSRDPATGLSEGTDASRG